jgi:hypothetical protein
MDSQRTSRVVYWLFAVSVALFISGIGFVIAAGRTSREAPAAPAAPETTPVATVAQIMNGITGPSANVIYNAVATYVSKEGVKEVAPQNDEEWARVADSAAALVESGNLLLLGNRAVDNGDWVKMARAMIDAGTKALKAEEAKSKDAILATGSDLNETCDTCHERYQRQ